MPWIEEEKRTGTLRLLVRVHPRARSLGIAGVTNDWLKIHIPEPPTDGRANDCLIQFLAEQLRIPKGKIELLQGGSSRTKRLRLHGIALEVARDRLLEQLGRS